MKNRKSKIISSVNLIAEERYLNSKFNLKEEEENGLPEFQVTPEGFGKYKIKYTWEKVGAKLPKDVRGDENFNKPEFEVLSKIYANQKDAQVAVDNFIKTISSNLNINVIEDNNLEYIQEALGKIIFDHNRMKNLVDNNIETI